MLANRSMALLLREQGIDIDAVCADNAFPIRKRHDRSGRAYWVVSHFWNLDRNGVPACEDLSHLEWDGNEVHLDAETKAGIARTLKKGVGIMKAWKRHLEQHCPDHVFCILAAYDNGDMLVNKEDYPDGFYSLNLRFWAVRDGNTVVNLTCFDEWDQPALLDICNEYAIPASERTLYPTAWDDMTEGDHNG